MGFASAFALERFGGLAHAEPPQLAIRERRRGRSTHPTKAAKPLRIDPKHLAGAVLGVEP